MMFFAPDPLKAATYGSPYIDKGTATGAPADDIDGNDNKVITVPNPQTNLQAAIDNASPGDTIIVGPGIYDTNLDFKGKDIILVSETGAANTILDGGGRLEAVVRMNTGEPPTATLDGFTVTNGAGHDLGNSTYFGGGVYLSGTSPTIKNCIITGNSANDGGGGIYSDGDTTSPTIENCTITANSTTNASGGGIYVASNAGANITKCIISDNVAGGSFAAGGGVYFGDYAIGDAANSTITGNSAVDGAGIYCGTYSIIGITNCTLSENTASNLGGGVYVSSMGSATILNTILWNDTATVNGNEIALFDGMSTTTFSDIDPADVYETSVLWTAANNINADPLFVSATDFHLAQGSPCIDKGTPSGAPTVDIDGDTRPMGKTHDIGSDEAGWRYYPDADADGYGDAADPGTIYLVDPGPGFSLDNTDCDDTDAAINPGATEICENGIDEDCSGADLPCPTNITSSYDYIGGPMNYVMISFPLTLGDTDPVNNLGPILNPATEFSTHDPLIYDPGIWRIYCFDNWYHQPAYPLTNLVPGRGYWVVGLNSAAISLTGLSVDSSQDFTITLAPGWNMIGNPFNFNVNVSDLTVTDSAGTHAVTSGAITMPNLYIYQNRTYVTSSQILPNHGYWIYNMTTADITLNIPPIIAPAIAAAHMYSAVTSGETPPAPPSMDEEVVEDGICFIATAAYEDQAPSLIDRILIWIRDVF
jgi:hypothetical protein